MGKRIAVVHCLPVDIIGFKSITAVDASGNFPIIQRHTDCYTGEALTKTVYGIACSRIIDTRMPSSGRHA